MADLKAFAEQLVNLTVKEVNELAQILKDEYGIEPAAANQSIFENRLKKTRLLPLVELLLKKKHLSMLF